MNWLFFFNIYSIFKFCSLLAGSCAAAEAEAAGADWLRTAAEAEAASADWLRTASEAKAASADWPLQLAILGGLTWREHLHHNCDSWLAPGTGLSFSLDCMRGQTDNSISAWGIIFRVSGMLVLSVTLSVET